MGIGLYEGDQVEYEIEDSERGQRASNVKKLKKAS
jgi:cold shock CspA family protein